MTDDVQKIAADAKAAESTVATDVKKVDAEALAFYAKAAGYVKGHIVWLVGIGCAVLGFAGGWLLH